MKEHSEFNKVSILDNANLEASALLEIFNQDFISLVVIKRDISDFNDYLESADLACKEDGATGKERVLLIEDATLLETLRLAKVQNGDTEETMESILKTVYGRSNSLQTLAFDDVAGFSVFPNTGKVAYVISKENANFLEVGTAFSTVVSSLPN